MPRNLVIYNITATRNQDSAPPPGSESMPSSMRADGMFNFTTDARVRAGMQGHLNSRHIKTETKITTRPWKRASEQERKTRGVCSLTSTNSQNESPSTATYPRKYGFYGSKCAPLIEQIPVFALTLIRTMVFIVKITGFVALTGDKIRRNRTHSGPNGGRRPGF